MAKTALNKFLSAVKDYTYPNRIVRAVAIGFTKTIHKGDAVATVGGNQSKDPVADGVYSFKQFDHPKQIQNFKILASDFGQFDSIQNEDCVNGTGERIPWYTYPAYEFVLSIDLTNYKITEYGSGNSSLFYISKAAILTSIEDNQHWYNKIKHIAAGEEKFTYMLCSDQKSYVEQDSVDASDIIIIDGAYRSACAQFVCNQIRKNKSDPYMIIFDNADWHPKTIRSIDEKLRWQRVDFSGFGPINNYCWTTSIFFNPRKPLIGNSDIRPVAGIRQAADDDVDFE